MVEYCTLGRLLLAEIVVKLIFEVEKWADNIIHIHTHFTFNESIRCIVCDGRLVWIRILQ